MIFGSFCIKFTFFVLFLGHMLPVTNGTSLAPNYDQLLITDLVDPLVRKISCYKIVAVVFMAFWGNFVQKSWLSIFCVGKKKPIYKIM